jgi:hypothetical protein
VATEVARSISTSSAKVCPANAARRKMRYPASGKCSQQAPVGMKLRGARVRGQPTVRAAATRQMP